MCAMSGAKCTAHGGRSSPWAVVISRSCRQASPALRPGPPSACIASGVGGPAVVSTLRANSMWSGWTFVRFQCAGQQCEGGMHEFGSHAGIISCQLRRVKRIVSSWPARNTDRYSC